jgi:hypothetical protein
MSEFPHGTTQRRIEFFQLDTVGCGRVNSPSTVSCSAQLFIICTVAPGVAELLQLEAALVGSISEDAQHILTSLRLQLATGLGSRNRPRSIAGTSTQNLNV